MKHTLSMAWRYLAYHRGTSLMLVGAIALIIFVPAALRVLVRQGEIQLTARAEATPLLLGARDSPLELALSALYFSGGVPSSIEFARTRDIAATGLADAIPLHVRFRALGAPIIGTDLAYFELRALRIEDGRQMAMLGECVVGAAFAAAHGVAPGDHVTSSPENVFDLAGVYPLRMHVVGVLASAGTPDDHAIFVDVKTAWIIEGRAHGHEDLQRSGAAGQVLGRDGANVVANASVREFQEITPENLASFHFHGDIETFPITAVIVRPHDAKSSALLLGRYQSNERLQLLRPIDVVDELLGTVFSVQNVIIVALAVVGVTTLALVVLVFLLSLRLRRREIDTMTKIGGARSRIIAILCVEMVGVLAAGVFAAAVLTWWAGRVGPEVVQRLLRQ